MIKKRAILCLSVILTVVLAAGVEMFWLSRQKTVKEYKESQVAFGNPLMGYARNAWYDKVSEDISLLYMDITWAELEPEEGVYDWEAIEKKNQLARWKSEGKHLVLRFVCDIPGQEEHMDIPEWLYEKSGKAGQWYAGGYGKGFAPDYNNPTIISCHEQAVKALGEHLGQDGLISYIELGSLGHWGVACKLQRGNSEDSGRRGKRTIYSPMDGGLSGCHDSHAETICCCKKTWIWVI